MSAATAAPPRVEIVETFQSLIRLIDAASSQPDDNFDGIRMCVNQMPGDHLRDVLLRAAHELAAQKKSKALFTYLVAKKTGAEAVQEVEMQRDQLSAKLQIAEAELLDMDTAKQKIESDRDVLRARAEEQQVQLDELHKAFADFTVGSENGSADGDDNSKVQELQTLLAKSQSEVSRLQQEIEDTVKNCAVLLKEHEKQNVGKDDQLQALTTEMKKMEARLVSFGNLMDGGQMQVDTPAASVAGSAGSGEGSVDTENRSVTRNWATIGSENGDRISNSGSTGAPKPRASMAGVFDAGLKPLGANSIIKNFAEQPLHTASTVKDRASLIALAAQVASMTNIMELDGQSAKLDLPPSLKNEECNKMLDRVRNAAKEVCKPRTIKSEEQILDALHDTLVKAGINTRKYLQQAARERKLDGAMEVYKASYVHAMDILKEQDDNASVARLQAAFGEDQQILVAFVKSGLVPKSEALRIDFESKDDTCIDGGLKIRFQDLTAQQGNGVIAMMMAKMHLVSDSWRDYLTSVQRLSDQFPLFEHMFGGCWTYYYAHLKKIFHEHEQIHGEISKTSIINAHMLQAILDGKLGHHRQFQKILQEQQLWDSKSECFVTMSQLLVESEIVKKALHFESSMEGKRSIFDKVISTEAQARAQAAQANTSTTSAGFRNRNARGKNTFFGLDKSYNEAVDWMVYFAGDTAPVCEKCSWPHSPDKGCMKLEHGKKLSEILGNLARILHHAEEQCARSVNRAKEKCIQARDVESLDKVVGELKALGASMAKIVTPPKQQHGARGGDKTKQQQGAQGGDKTQPQSGDNDGDKSKNPGVCREYLLGQPCTFKKKCKYAHPPGLKGSQKSNAGSGRTELAHISEDTKAAYKALEEQFAVVKKEQAKTIKELETQLKATAPSGAALGSQTFSNVGMTAGDAPRSGGDEDHRAMNAMMTMSKTALESVTGTRHPRMGSLGAEFGFVVYASGTPECPDGSEQSQVVLRESNGNRTLPAPPPGAISFSSEFEMETVATFFRLMGDLVDDGCHAYGSVQGYMDMIGNEQLRMSASSAAAGEGVHDAVDSIRQDYEIAGIHGSHAFFIALDLAPSPEWVWCLARDHDASTSCLYVMLYSEYAAWSQQEALAIFGNDVDQHDGISPSIDHAAAASIFGGAEIRAPGVIFDARAIAADIVNDIILEVHNIAEDYVYVDQDADAAQYEDIGWTTVTRKGKRHMPVGTITDARLSGGKDPPVISDQDKIKGQQGPGITMSEFKQRLSELKQQLGLRLQQAKANAVEFVKELNARYDMHRQLGDRLAHDFVTYAAKAERLGKELQDRRSGLWRQTDQTVYFSHEVAEHRRRIQERRKKLMLTRDNFVRPVNFDGHKLSLREDKKKYILMTTHRKASLCRPLPDRYLPESTFLADTRRRMHELLTEARRRIEELNLSPARDTLAGAAVPDSDSTLSSVAKCARRAADHLKRRGEAEGFAWFENWLSVLRVRPTKRTEEIALNVLIEAAGDIDYDSQSQLLKYFKHLHYARVGRLKHAAQLYRCRNLRELTYEHIQRNLPEQLESLNDPSWQPIIETPSDWTRKFSGGTLDALGDADMREEYLGKIGCMMTSSGDTYGMSSSSWEKLIADEGRPPDSGSTAASECERSRSADVQAPSQVQTHEQNHMSMPLYTCIDQSVTRAATCSENSASDDDAVTIVCDVAKTNTTQDTDAMPMLVASSSDDESDDGDCESYQDVHGHGGKDPPDQIGIPSIYISSGSHDVQPRGRLKHASSRHTRCADKQDVVSHRYVSWLINRTSRDLPHPLSAVSKLEPYRLFRFDEDTQEYAHMFTHNEVLNFIHSCYATYTASDVDVILWLVDSGTTCFLSPNTRHMFVDLKCKTTINGVGQATCNSCAPLIMSFVGDNLSYVTLAGAQVLKMPSLPFPLFSTGYAESLGFEFVFNWNHPVMTDSKGVRVPMIKDRVTGFTWIAERPRAITTVRAQRKFLQELDQSQYKDQVISDKIIMPALSSAEPPPTHPDDQSHVDAILRAKAPTSHFGGGSNTRKSPRFAVSEEAEKQEKPAECRAQVDSVKTRADNHTTRETACALNLECCCPQCEVFSDDFGKRLETLPACQKRPGCKCEKCILYYTDGMWNEVLASHGVSRPKQESVKDVKPINVKSETKVVKCDVTDQEYIDKDRLEKLAKKKKPIKLRLPAMRLVDTGEEMEVQKLKTYLHDLFGHLGESTIYDAVKMIDGAEILKAILILKGSVDKGHCDSCVENASVVPPAPEGKVPRPYVKKRIKKIFVDLIGKVEEDSLFHGYHHALVAATDEGFILLEGMVYKSQALFCLGKVYNDLGGAPEITQIDHEGALVGKVGEIYINSRNSKRVVTEGGDHYRNGFVERRNRALKDMGRKMMWKAGTPTSYWYYALAHAALILNMVTRARGEHGVARDVTVWEAHYGQRPNVSDKLIGPWGCLAYLILTREQRDKKGLSSHWGVRAIPGIYIGCYVNPQTLVFRHLITDGVTVFASANRVKTVGDVYPLRIMTTPGPQIPRPDDADDDEMIYGYMATEDLDDSLDEKGFARMIVDAVLDRSTESLAEMAFAGRYKGSDEKHPKGIRKREMTDEERRSGRQKKRAIKVVSEILNDKGELGKRSVADCLQEVEGVDVEINLENPLDVELKVAPPAHDMQLPYDGAKYYIAIPTNLSDEKVLPVKAEHPHNRFINRKVRKYFPLLDSRKQKMWKSFEGEVTKFSPRRALFRIDYSDKDWEEQDFEELQQILIMDEAYGDSASEAGKTRQEVNEALQQQALLAEVMHEMTVDRVPTTAEDQQDAEMLRAEFAFNAHEEYKVPIYDDEPQHYKEVLQHPEKDQILEAASKEIKQLKDYGVGVFPKPEDLPRIRREHQVLRARMVYKRKYTVIEGADGVAREYFLKWKGRLAVQGTRETPGVDTVWSTFSPTIGFTAVRVLISLMCDPKFSVDSYDLSGAYLKTDLKDRAVYVQLPNDAGEDAGKIIRLVKACYGLKSASSEFIKQLRETVLTFECEGCKFRPLKIDHCVYVFEGKGGEKMILAGYVDDLICGTTDETIRDKFLAHLRKGWDVTHEGQLDRFIGVHFKRSADKMTWAASMGTYIDRVVRRFGLEETKIYKTPMDAGFALTEEDFKEEPTEDMKSLYRSLIGSIGFAATAARFDIAFAVSVLSRHLAKPCTKVIDAAKRVIKYLKYTRDLKIEWWKEGNVIGDQISGSVDASFANCVLTRKSHGGWINFLNNGPVSWKSGLQPIVTLSSCEAEYVALSMEVCEVKYLRALLHDLGWTQQEPTLVWEDNRAAIMVAENESSSAGRCKHIDVKFKFVAEAIGDGAVKIRYTPSMYNFADIMTKPLTEAVFDRLVRMCLGSKRNQLAERAAQQEGYACYFGDESFMMYL